MRAQEGSQRTQTIQALSWAGSPIGCWSAYIGTITGFLFSVHIEVDPLAMLEQIWAAHLRYRLGSSAQSVRADPPWSLSRSYTSTGQHSTCQTSRIFTKQRWGHTSTRSIRIDYSQFFFLLLLFMYPPCTEKIWTWFWVLELDNAKNLPVMRHPRMVLWMPL